MYLGGVIMSDLTTRVRIVTLLIRNCLNNLSNYLKKQWYRCQGLLDKGIELVLQEYKKPTK